MLAIHTYALEHLYKAIHHAACIEVNPSVMGFESLDKAFNEG
jgi:hypothetical protein